jgi:CDP-diacylglycerol---serine O-phosphatidyltransferase
VIARFNVVASTSSQFFVGLPTPVAACFLASIVMSHAWLIKSDFSVFAGPQGLMICALSVAFFMVSTIPCFSFKRYKITHRYGPIILFAVLAGIGFAFICQYPVLFFMSLSYIVMMFAQWCVNSATRWRA